MLESLFNKEQKQTPTQVFPCECFKISKNTYFEEYQGMAASDSHKDTS